LAPLLQFVLAVGVSVLVTIVLRVLGVLKDRVRRARSDEGD
jgi:hypothetical protein